MAVENRDVVIVGAGLSGLAAAKVLIGTGKSVVVLEARDRPGGRCYHSPLGFDLGAEYIATNHIRLTALAEWLGLDMTFPVKGSTPSPTTALEATNDIGKAVLYLNGKRSTGDPDSLIPPGLNLITLGRLWLLMQEIAHDIKSLQPFMAAPWEAPNAAKWDALSVEGWLQSGWLETEDDKELIRMVCRAIWSVEAPEMSFLYFLWYVAANGGLDVIASPSPTPNASQGFRFKNGTQQVADLLAQKLGVVRYRAAATRISQDATGVNVTASDGTSYRARYAIVAMSPVMSSMVAYEPPLPSGRTQLCQHAAMGRTLKCIFIYPEAYWRPAYSGLCNSNLAPVTWVMDNCNVAGTAALMSFVVGAQADRLQPMTEAQRVDLVTSAFVEIFDDPRLKHPTSYIIQDWAQEPWTRGCPVGVMPPNAMTSYGRYLFEPSGRIYWAGTESSTVWTGYMEGAVAAGYPRGEEVLALL